MKRFFVSLCCASIVAAVQIAPLTSALAQDTEAYARKQQQAALQSYGAKARLETFRRAGTRYEAQATYPQFRADDLLSRFASWRLRTEARERVAEWEKQTLKDLKEFTPSPGASFYLEQTAQLVRATPRLISLTVDWSSYTGGAHGMYATEGVTYSLLPGETRPRELQLGDFFQKGAPYRAHIEKLLLDRLRATKGSDQEATWVVDGELKSMPNEFLNNFVVEKDGLRWFFAPYAVGPYAAGQFEVKLTAKELGASFKRELLG